MVCSLLHQCSHHHPQAFSPPALLQVPDEVVVEMVKTRLAQSDVQASGWLLDGYPRSASQAEAIEKESIRPDVFLLIDVSAAHRAVTMMHGNMRWQGRLAGMLRAVG
jgi:adenylate kinase family enzyme